VSTILLSIAVTMLAFAALALGGLGREKPRPGSACGSSEGPADRERTCVNCLRPRRLARPRGVEHDDHDTARR
jgi:hypothetical protein